MAPTTRHLLNARLTSRRVAYEAAAVYSIGPLSQLRLPVTIYSQQIRALRLADSLAQIHRNRGDLEVVDVVGAGVAGITFAVAFASEVLDLRVRVWDSAMQPFSRQRDSERYIHPHIFDWPEPGWNRTRAALPVLSWDAGTARGVVAEQWDPQLAAALERLDITMHQAKVLRVEPQMSGGHGSQRARVETENGTHESSLVVIATGFGPDRVLRLSGDMPANCRLHTEEYWRSKLTGQPWRSDDTLTVIGGGDGAVAEVYSALFTGDYLQALCSDPDFLATSTQLVTNPDLVVDLTDEQSTIQVASRELAPAVVAALDPLRRKPSPTILTCAPDFQAASPLNRCLVAIAEKEHWSVRSIKGEVQAWDKLSTSQGSHMVVPRVGPDPVELEIGQGANRKAIGTSNPPVDVVSLRRFPEVEQYEVSSFL